MEISLTVGELVLRLNPPRYVPFDFDQITSAARLRMNTGDVIFLIIVRRL